MDILNFISWIRTGKYTTTAPDNAVTVIGVPNPTRGDTYLPVTVPITTFQTNIGKFIGGGILVGEWFENGVHKALIASLTNLGEVHWSPVFNTLIGPTAQSWSDGLGNTNAIIAQTGASANTTYAAGAAKLHNGGGYNDWYLPAAWEMNICYNSAAIVNRILGADGFQTVNGNYWSSTEEDISKAMRVTISSLTVVVPSAKSSGSGITSVRAVRIHTL